MPQKQAANLATDISRQPQSGIPPSAPFRLIRRSVVLQKTGLTRSALYRAMDAATFPRPVAIGKNAVAWAEHEVDAWIQARIADRDAKDKPS